MLQRLNSAVKLIQRTTRRLLLHRTGCLPEDYQLLREGGGCSRSSGRKDWVHAPRAGRLDQDPSSTPDDRHGSDESSLGGSTTICFRTRKR